MTAFIIRRLLQAAFVVFAVVTLVFFLIRVSGDPASLGVNLDDFRSAEQIQAEYEDIRQRMGLDRHIMVQYGIFWYRAFQLNFGYSFRYGVPATRLIVERLPNSLRLGAVAAVIGIVVGLPLGVIAALKRGTIIDNLTTSVAVFGIVVPQFWLGIMLIIIFSVELGLLPTSGTGSWKHIILPAVTLSTGLTATVARIPVGYAGGPQPGLHPHGYGQGTEPTSGHIPARAPERQHLRHHRRRVLTPPPARHRCRR